MITDELQHEIIKVLGRLQVGSSLEEQADAVLALIAPVMEENERLLEAMTPSAETKAAYIGEFSFSFPIGFDDDGHDVHHTVNVPWCTIKEIMATIKARAAWDDELSFVVSNTLDEAADAISTLLKEMAWRTIDSAPNEGPILVWDDEAQEPQIAYPSASHPDRWANDEGFLLTFRYWQPIDPPAK
jgi:hypothetical protein